MDKVNVSVTIPATMRYVVRMTFSPRILITALLAAAVFAVAAPAQAASSADLSRNAWIPYWNEAGGIREARANLADLTSVSAFGYEVNSSGKLADKMGLKDDPWKDFMKDAKREKVKVYATVSWFDGQAIHETLSDKKKRSRHIDAIMKEVRSNPDLAGIEIDYEGKLAETNADFSKFLAELQKKLKAKKKRLVCDIEPRTPAQDRYGAGATIPASAYVFANDYRKIGAACDEVRVMAYDQGLADVTLVRSGPGPYAPVADPAWAAKVMKAAAAEIPARKLVQGIPTYGRVYRIDAAGGYTQISSITYPDAIALAARQGVTPTRNRSGELSFSYTGLTSGLPGNATPTGLVNRYFVTVSDGAAIAAHVTLAKSLGLGGVALFKLDGQTDPAAWTGFFK